MNKTLGLFRIGLELGDGIGFIIAACNGITFDSHDHADPFTHESGKHNSSHDTPVVVFAEDAPRITVDLARAPRERYYLHVQARNFTFMTSASGLKNVTEEGHAHVYIYDVKLGHLYGDWMRIAHLRPKRSNREGRAEQQRSTSAGHSRTTHYRKQAADREVIVTACPQSEGALTAFLPSERKSNHDCHPACLHHLPRGRSA